MFQRIMVTWDGSDVARDALGVAIDVARRYDAELVVVSVAYSPAHAETDADRADSADRAHRAGVDVVHQIIDGDTPARALLDHAHEHGFDLIVCGHHHMRRSGRLLLRGIASELFAEALVPVLVVGESSHR
jgi:nucleotide-binding universal stress UspA family protein